jgi:DNA-binding NtrC family response regulator
MTVPWEVLVVSSNVEGRRDLTAMLRRESIDPVCASSVRECQEVLAKEGVGLVFATNTFRTEPTAT